MADINVSGTSGPDWSPQEKKAKPNEGTELPNETVSTHQFDGHPDIVDTTEILDKGPPPITMLEGGLSDSEEEPVDLDGLQEAVSHLSAHEGIGDYSDDESDLESESLVNLSETDDGASVPGSQPDVPPLDLTGISHHSNHDGVVSADGFDMNSPHDFQL